MDEQGGACVAVGSMVELFDGHYEQAQSAIMLIETVLGTSRGDAGTSVGRAEVLRRLQDPVTAGEVLDRFMAVSYELDRYARLTPILEI